MASLVVEKNRANALRNPHAAFGAKTRASEVEKSAPVADPLRRMDIADWADGGTVVVLASESAAKRHTGRPVWITGLDTMAYSAGGCSGDGATRWRVSAAQRELEEQESCALTPALRPW